MHLGSATRRLRRLALALLSAAATACCPGLFTPATTLMTPHGEVTAVLGDADEFPRFRMPDHGRALHETPVAEVADDADLIVIERGEQARALLVDEMTWHHVAEGTLDEHPIAVVY